MKRLFVSCILVLSMCLLRAQIIPSQILTGPSITDAGIDINNPKYGRWLNAHDHLSKAREYNDAWEAFFLTTKNPSVQQIEEFANKVMHDIYGK